MHAHIKFQVKRLAAETFTKQVFTSLLSAKPNEIKGEEEKAPQPRGRQKTGIRFTKQEMKKHKTGDEKDANEIP